MTYPFASASARPVGRFFATAATAALVTVFAASTVLAQQPAPAPAPAKPAPAPARPAAPAARPAAPAKPATPPAAQAPAAPAAPQAGAAPQQQPQLIYSPWTKFCLKGQEKDAKQVCFTGKDARIESGMPVVAAVLIEPDAPDAKKVLRVTVPLGVQLTHGTRVIVDQNQPMQGPFVICFTNGCMSDYEANPAMITSLKKGQGLTVQAINAGGQPISLVLPLGDFAKANEGPPTDPKVFEEQQKKLQDELQKRAEDARKKLEAQTPNKTQ